MATDTARIAALARHLGADPQDITRTPYDTYQCSKGEFRVLTDAEADKATREEIENSLWAFNADFIAAHAQVAIPPPAQRALRKMAEELCEDASGIFAAIIGTNFPAFVEDAIRADGRGHFLSGWDGEEIDLGEDLYAYRVN